MTLLTKELKRFWKWAKMSPEEYADTPDCGDWEADYPYWDDLYKAAFETVSVLNQKGDTGLYPLLLEALAIDCKNEKIIKIIENSLVDKEKCYKFSLDYIQPESRQQIAKLMSKVRIEKSREFLITLARDDEIDYVQGVALRSLSKIDSKLAEEIAFKKIRHDNDYVRLVSLRMLHELASFRLKDAVDYLKNDKSEHIQLAIKSIEKEETQNN